MANDNFKNYEELDERINGLEKMLGQLKIVTDIIDLMEIDSVNCFKVREISLKYAGKENVDVKELEKIVTTKQNELNELKMKGVNLTKLIDKINQNREKISSEEAAILIEVLNEELVVLEDEKGRLRQEIGNLKDDTMINEKKNELSMLENKMKELNELVNVLKDGEMNLAKLKEKGISRFKVILNVYNNKLNDDRENLKDIGDLKILNVIRDTVGKTEKERIAKILSNMIENNKEKPNEGTEDLKVILKVVNSLKNDDELIGYIKDSISLLGENVKKEKSKWSDKKIIKEIEILQDEINYKLDGKLTLAGEVNIYDLIKLQSDNIFALAKERMAYYNLEQIENLKDDFNDNNIGWYANKIGKKIKTWPNDEMKKEFQNKLNNITKEQAKNILTAIKIEESKKYDKRDYSNGIYNKNYEDIMSKGFHPKELVKWSNNVIDEYFRELSKWNIKEITINRKHDSVGETKKRDIGLLDKVSKWILKPDKLIKNGDKLARGGVFSQDRRHFVEIGKHTHMLHTAINKEEGSDELNNLKKDKDIKKAYDYARKRVEKESKIGKVLKRIDSVETLNEIDYDFDKRGSVSSIDSDITISEERELKKSNVIEQPIRDFIDEVSAIINGDKSTSVPDLSNTDRKDSVSFQSIMQKAKSSSINVGEIINESNKIIQSESFSNKGNKIPENSLGKKAIDKKMNKSSRDI